MTNKIANIPVYERPRERMKRLGAKSLASDELLAILLGSGSSKDPVLKVARELMIQFRSLKGVAQASLEELIAIPGIGLAKALQLQAAFSLSERYHYEEDRKKIIISSPEHAFKVALPYILNEKREYFLTLLLAINKQLITTEIISIGTLTATLVHPREFFYPAIKRKAAGIIAVHNHPSGSLNPSKEDIELTLQLIEVAKIVNIPILDHLIIAPNGFYSLKDHGINF